MRVFFLRQGPLGECTFKYALGMASSGFTIVGAGSNSTPEKTWWHSAEIYRLSQVASLHFVPNERRNETLLAKSLIATHADMILSVGHPWVLSPYLLSLVNGRAINLHPAPLPNYGGFNTVSHAILEGAQEFGVTLHWATERADEGPIIERRLFGVPSNVTARGLHKLVVNSGYEVLTNFMSQPKLWLSHAHRNDSGKPCRFFPRNALDGYREITDMSNSEEVGRKSRAFYFPPFPPAFALINGENSKLFQHLAKRLNSSSFRVYTC